ncbi:hypothetical protein NNJEOMEG_02115 [Fundidesulfovibrio magnetotacticus]|uniref:Heme exporter protein B n=1 Tax=Fundidesulfovibrio magnetotacticus TaxID=2730080 RepID=A0A6V8LNV0_9BACT|nr:heme exporter protein CcmB [Fundidesulfovibrio magnetotacticus]GFK94273.1 hypothetical protein NNJEOMEG_02115 [Fundidesulfovibrio magnetotacticus]
MLKASAAIAAKDLRLTLRGAQGLAQTALLGLLIIFVFSLSRRPGEEVPALAAAAIFWLSTLFSQVLVFNGLYALEEGSGARLGLAMAPAPVQSVWLGKALAGFALVGACQVVFALAVAVFLDQGLAGSALTGLGCVLLSDAGLAALGSFMGALASGRSARESLLTVIFFPLVIPVLLAGIKVLEGVILGTGQAMDWMGLSGAFAAVFSGASLVLFPYIYTGEE